ncbi:MAG: DUF4278 domain-containing protein [Cyanobacteria bacterium P01_D01_bin.44]
MMNLSYRGIKYTSANQSVDVMESEALGRYRGATYRIKQVTSVPAQSRSKGLVYRGAVVR